MKQKLVTVSTYGCLAEHLGHETWKLSVQTVGNALNAIEVLSKRKLYRFLHENDKKGIKYRVLINGHDFLYDQENPPKIDNLDSIRNTELCAKINNLESIEIVPVIEGSGGNGASIGTMIAGVILIVVGVILSGFGGALLIVAGIGLLAAGIMNLLMKPPEIDQFKAGQKKSYLFSGPINTIGEGGPVPLLYGEAIIGSSVISASYDISTFSAKT